MENNLKCPECEKQEFFHNEKTDEFICKYCFTVLKPRKEFIPFVEGDWLDYFERNLIRTKINEKEAAYEYLMKYGLSRNYWNEYVFLSYRNYQHDMVLLEGFPDIPSSLPHS